MKAFLGTGNIAVLLELRQPSFNTVIYNAKIKFTARTVTVYNSVISIFC